MTTTILLADLHSTLFTWWLKHGRVLPWRTKLTTSANRSGQRTIQQPSSVLEVRDQAFHDYMANDLRRDPYKVVVAELMLQQTQVDRVLSKYEDWMKRWPDISDLAKAELSEVLIFWKGLGYNRRARFLWLLAKKINEDFHGVWPRTEAELLALPGIGKYTARAVMSFAFGEEVAVVDTNVKRVLRRVLDGQEAAALPVPSEKEWFSRADAVLPSGKADPWNQLMMDFGATICTARAPKCEVCPVQTTCKAQQIALSKGFPTYGEYLMAFPVVKTNQKKAVRFEDTDRYFRGRIMDILRENQISLADLNTTLQNDYGLVDQHRFERLLAGLSKDGMITLSDNTASLA